ncbi:protein YIPF3 [Aplysia californica]|uniref:Protein YIPF3 n=1 Tax=Aplysia californica TaxID=6500 RepID=A0ABM1A3X8_APLCA|nr:protein YIPF3 [Aplysia californica]
MADKSWQTQAQSEPGSAVLDMDLEEMEMMDDHGSSTAGGGKGQGGLADDMRQRMGENVTQMFWQAGTQSAKRAWSVYGNIDVLRPYFDVEPREVQMRLLFSLVPLKPNDQRLQVPKELYGPTMVVLTLIALLLYQMKTADHRVEEGTLIGSAFGVCFMYWLGASCTVWFAAYVCNIRFAALQVLSMMGYGLSSHCIVILLGTVLHTSHDHMFFYLLWAGVGGLATLRMATIVMSRTRGQKERMIVIGTIAALHLLFLLYLHFAYHTIVEEISDALNEKLVPVAMTYNQQTDSAAALGQLPGNDAPLVHDAPIVGGVRDALIPNVALKDAAAAESPLSFGKSALNDTALKVAVKPQNSIILGKLKNSGVIHALNE